MPDRATVHQQQLYGVLITKLPVRLLEISHSGCLLECARRIDVGASGELRVDVDGQSLLEELRVTRCDRIEGSGATYRIGAEFLLTRRPDTSSLRRTFYATLTADRGVRADASLRLAPLA